jgi:hypothetical protein
MSKFDEKMNELFDMPSTTIDSPDVSVPVVSEQSQDDKVAKILDRDLMKDYEETRNNLKEIANKGALAIDDILTIARESEHPRAFEVAATMIKNVAEANEKLINLQKQMKELTGTQKQSQLNVGKAAIFVGSTAELSKLVKNQMRTIENGEE